MPRAHLPNTCKDIARARPAYAGAPAVGLTGMAKANDEVSRDERIDRSIRRGLAFISRGQTETGTFDSHPARNYTGIPALCGMAFLAVGDVPGPTPNGALLERIIDHLLERARDDGYLGTNGGKMYSHCISTLFLCEVSGMVDTNRQAKIDALLPRAVRIILDAQAVKKSQQNQGGWRYEPNSTDSDMSCSGWALMALRSARLNGAPVPDKAIDDAVGYLLRHHNTSTGTFGYQDPNSNAEKLTGAGLLCLELCGRHGHPATLRAARYLGQNFTRLQNVDRRFYGMYYASQGLFQIGGEAWKDFSNGCTPTGFPARRRRHWDMGEDGCPYYQTALVVLAFTVPYRQLPIYQRDETVDETGSKGAGFRVQEIPSFVASFVGNFVAFVEYCWFSLTEAQRHGGTDNRNR